MVYSHNFLGANNEQNHDIIVDGTKSPAAIIDYIEFNTKLQLPRSRAFKFFVGAEYKFYAVDGPEFNIFPWDLKMLSCKLTFYSSETAYKNYINISPFRWTYTSQRDYTPKGYIIDKVLTINDMEYFDRMEIELKIDSNQFLKTLRRWGAPDTAKLSAALELYSLGIITSSEPYTFTAQ